MHIYAACVWFIRNFVFCLSFKTLNNFFCDIGITITNLAFGCFFRKCCANSKTEIIALSINFLRERERAMRGEPEPPSPVEMVLVSRCVLLVVKQGRGRLPRTVPY